MADAATHEHAEPFDQPFRLGYVTSRFPVLVETFVLFEILALERAGIDVDVYPLLRHRERVVHPESIEVRHRAHYFPFVSFSILASQLHFLLRGPRAYFAAWAAVLRGTWGSRNFFIGAIGIFPKVAHMARRMESAGVRHVHCAFATHPAVAGFVIRRLTGIPFSFTAHGSDLHVDRHMLCEKLAEASFVVTISRFNEQVIIRECGEEARRKVVLIRSGTDTEYFRPPDHGRCGKPCTILCIGRMDDGKGHRYLVDACRRLVEDGVDFQAQLVGDGPNREALGRQIFAAGLGDRIGLEEARPRPKIAELMRSADILVAPSVPTEEGKKEGIPVVLMEAMSSGLPVIASQLAGIPELVEDGRTGLLVPPGDVVALEAAIRRLVEDSHLRDQLGRAARERAVAEYDIYRNAAKLADHIFLGGP